MKNNFLAQAGGWNGFYTKFWSRKILVERNSIADTITIKGQRFWLKKSKKGSGRLKNTLSSVFHITQASGLRKPSVPCEKHLKMWCKLVYFLHLWNLHPYTVPTVYDTIMFQKCWFWVLIRLIRPIIRSKLVYFSIYQISIPIRFQRYMAQLVFNNVDFGSLMRLIRPLIRPKLVYFCIYEIFIIIRFQRYMTRLCFKNVDFGSLIRLIRPLIRPKFVYFSINRISIPLRFQRYMTRLCFKNVDIVSLIRLIRPLIRPKFVYFCTYQISIPIRFQRYMTRLCFKNFDFGSLITLIRVIRPNYGGSPIIFFHHDIFAKVIAWKYRMVLSGLAEEPIWSKSVTTRTRTDGDVITIPPSEG